MKRLITVLLLSLLVTFNVNGQDGASLFKKNCAVCHSIGNGKLVGPDLKDADKKHDIKWLIKWVKSSQSLIKEKDQKAVQLFNDNNKMVMPDQALSDTEIKTLVSFIGEETAKIEQPVAVAPSPVAAVTNQYVSANQSEKQSNEGISSTTVIYLMVGINVFLVLIIYGLSMIIKDLARNYNKDRHSK